MSVRLIQTTCKFKNKGAIASRYGITIIFQVFLLKTKNQNYTIKTWMFFSSGSTFLYWWNKNWTSLNSCGSCWGKHRGTFDHVLCSCWKIALRACGERHRAMANVMVLKVWSDVARDRGECHKPMANTTNTELAFSAVFFFSSFFSSFLLFSLFISHMWVLHRQAPETRHQHWYNTIKHTQNYTKMHTDRVK